MIKKLFLALTIVLMATTAVAQTMLGELCDNPIPVNKDYEATVDGPCTLWYSATTYDLPLNVHFTPVAADSEWGPDVVIDLTCTKGFYADPKLDSIIRFAEGFNYKFPVALECPKDLNHVTNKVEYDLFIDNVYREQLAEFGVTYNVAAYVKVTFYEAGSISLKPDTAFSSCMNNSQAVVLDDSIAIQPNDSGRVFMMPYTDWQEDSIQFVWTGSEPAYVYMAQTKCDFDPKMSKDNPYAWACYTVKSGEPYRVSNKSIMDAITMYEGGGLFYSKVLSASAGKLVVEKIPMKQAEGGAILLEYGKPVQLVANDTNTLFCFPKTWTATEFVSSSAKPIAMYASNVTEFTTQKTDANLLTYYDFSMVGTEGILYLSSRDLRVLANKAIDEYIYVRFLSKVATTITPHEWHTSDCVDNSNLIMHGKEMEIAKKTSLVYRLRYDDWKGYDILLDWKCSSALPTFVGDTCAFALKANTARVPYAVSVAKNSVHTIPAATVNSWADRVDPDGYFYVRFNPNAAGNLTVTSSRPEPAPEPESPCVVGSIELKAGDQITLNLDSAFTIYRINYAEWVAKDNKLAWSGSESLHTFVAETCQFSVAPYNKYVVNYVVVPAAGEYVLDVATLTQYADKVDADGYLYIRFLTEKEGTLSVTSY